MNTTEKIVDIINKNQEREMRDNLIFQNVRKVLEGFVGKKMTKRIETACQKHFDEILPKKYRIMYDTEYGSYKLNIVPLQEKIPSFDWENRLVLYLGGRGNGLFSFEDRASSGAWKNDGFDSASGFAGKYAEDRIKSRNELLKNTKKIREIADAIDNYNSARAVLLDDKNGLLSYDAGIEDRYSIEKLMDGTK